MTTHYHWIHLPTNTYSTSPWSEFDKDLSEGGKLKLVNEWNRVGALGPNPLTYHYWM